MSERLPFDDFVQKKLGDLEPDVPVHIWKNIVAAKDTRRPKGFWISFLSPSTLIIAGLALLLLGGGYYFLAGTKPGAVDQAGIEKEKAHTIPSGKQAVDHGNAILSTKEDEKSEKQDQASIDIQSTTQSTSPYLLGGDSRWTGKRKAGSSTTHFDLNVPSSFLDDGSQSIKENVAENNRQPRAGDQKPLLNISSLEEKWLQDKVSNAPKLKLPDCPTIEKNAAGDKRYLEAYAGPDYAFSNYKTFGDTSSYNYAQRRKDAAGFSSAYSAGLRYTRVFNNAMSLRTGVNFSQINEKFKYVNPSELRFITVITTRVIIRSPGDTIYINDTLRYQQSGSRVKTTNNRYRSIDIPLMMGYEMGNGRLHANFSAGAMINIYSWYKGDILDTSYQPVSITTGKGSSNYQFKTNIGVGFITSVSVYYKLNDQWHLLLEPYFRYNLSPMSKEALNLQQRYHTAGIRAGIRLDLGQRNK